MLGGNLIPEKAHRLRNRTYLLLASALAFGLGACGQSAPGAEAAEAEEMEFLEFAAAPEELAVTPVNEIVKSLRMNATAMRLGERVYNANCAGCHGADLKGTREQHAPDLDTGGVVKLPSDVEWTVLYGIRNEHPKTRGLEADMVAYLPEFRNDHDKEAYGAERFLTDEQIDDVTEFVMQVGKQTVTDTAKAARGRAIFQDTGNCFDCHGDDAAGNEAFGSANLTKPELYLFGSDRATIIETIKQGRRGTMPAFEGKLRPEEAKAVSVFVFSRSGKEPLPPRQ
jgi:cytochrome c oxidase cbb3-type subunit III